MVPLAVYTMEAVRNFQAMDSHVKKGETLTLVLGNQKLCLVHRKDDLPFVVPMAYVCLRTQPEEKPGPRSFSKFLLRGRKAGSSSRSRQQYPLSTSFNLESSVRPQFAIVTDSFSATSQNEVDLLRDTSVLILNADPQSLYWFGVTQFGAYGLLPKNNVSVITQKGTPSLQQGCRLTAYTRRAYKSKEHDEVAVMKGWILEIIGMPEMWRWQVRLSKGERKVGLLPLHVIGEVSVIASPNIGAPSEIMSSQKSDDAVSLYSSQYEARLDPFNSFSRKEKQRRYMNVSQFDEATLNVTHAYGYPDQPSKGSGELTALNITSQTSPSFGTYHPILGQATSVRPRSMLDTTDMNPSQYIPVTACEESVERRPSPPLPRIPITTLAPHESGRPQELVSNEAAVPMRLHGVSHPPSEEDGDVSHGVHDYVAVGEDVQDDRFDAIERHLRGLRQDCKTEKQSSEENRWEAKHWKRTVDIVFQVLDEARATSQSRTDLQDPEYGKPADYFSKLHQMFRDRDSQDSAPVDYYTLYSRQDPTYSLPDLDSPPEDGRIGSGTVPRNEPPATGCRASLGTPGTAPSRAAPYSTTGRRASLGTSAMLNTALHGTAQPMIDLKGVDASTAGKLVIMPTRLSNLVIDAVVGIVCPPDVKRPRLHWLPFLVKLGLQEDRARGIERSQPSFREQWREALVAWRDRIGQESTTSIFLGEMEATGHKDLYEKIVSECTLPVKPAQCSRGAVEFV